MLCEKRTSECVQIGPVAHRGTSRRRGQGHLISAILSLSGGHGIVLRHDETVWASITFSGKRHMISLLFTGTDAIARGEEMIAALPDHEFTMPGKLVADAAVTKVDHRMVPTETCEISIELLVLDEA